jgi:hypothetical protein
VLEKEIEIYFRNLMPHVANMDNFGRLGHFRTSLQQTNTGVNPYFPSSKEKLHSKFLTRNKGKNIHFFLKHGKCSQYNQTTF